MNITANPNESFMLELMKRFNINTIAALLEIIRNGNFSEEVKQNLSIYFNLTAEFERRIPRISSSAIPYEYIDGGMIAIKVFFYGLYLLIFFLGIAGNALVCYVVLRNSAMHTVTNIFILNLALSDVLLCLFAVPFTPLYLIVYRQWVFGAALCHLVPFAQGLQLLIWLMLHVWLIYFSDLINFCCLDVFVLSYKVKAYKWDVYLELCILFCIWFVCNLFVFRKIELSWGLYCVSLWLHIRHSYILKMIDFDANITHNIVSIKRLLYDLLMLTECHKY